MVAKVIGLATGAFVASVGVWAFNEWRHVSDDDLLTEILADHCLPYVQTGAVPFEGMGRTPGVYDAIDLIKDIEGGGVLLIHDARFVAQWGLAPNDGQGGNTTLRMCSVTPTYAANTIAGFDVDPDGFIARYSTTIAPDDVLVPDTDILVEGPQTVGWFNANGDVSDGVRVVMVASPGLVSSVLTVADLD